MPFHNHTLPFPFHHTPLSDKFQQGALLESDFPDVPRFAFHLRLSLFPGSPGSPTQIGKTRKRTKRKLFKGFNS